LGPPPPRILTPPLMWALCNCSEAGSFARTPPPTINGYSAFWLGFIRNHVRGTVRLSNNDMGDPDANEYVTNTIKGNLVCHNNSPAPQVGDSEGLPNVVTGRKVDQCAVPGL
jgi:hypothetical protein